MILQIAWKNIWRNKLRSAVVIAAIAIGLLAGIVSVAFMNGALLDRVDTAINNEVSSLQLHNPEYLKNSEATALIQNPDSIYALLDGFKEVKAYSGRLKLEAMLNHGHGPRGAIVYGVDPQMEKALSGIAKTIVDTNGTWFETDKRNPIVLSTRLAEKLKVKLNGKVQLDAVDKNGQATASVFRVVGLYRTENSMFDELNAYARLEDLQRIFEFDSKDIHEIAILNHEIMETDSTEIKLRKALTRYAIDSNVVLSLSNLNLKPYILNYYKSLSGKEAYSYSEFKQMFLEHVNEEDRASCESDLFSACERGVNVMAWGTCRPKCSLLPIGWIYSSIFLWE